MDINFLRTYFQGKDAGYDRTARPEVFKQRIAAALSDAALARELAKNSTFAQAVASQFGIAAYRQLMDRDPNKTPDVVQAERVLRSQNREPYAAKRTLGDDPNAFPRTALHAPKPATPRPPDVPASPELREIAGGLPAGATVSEALAELSKP